jgi:glycosyltransferase involved in cell wall biosynthesis
MAPQGSPIDASDTAGPVPGDDSPLTVLIVADTFPPDVNGAANFAMRLAAGLTERGHDVHVLAQSHNNRAGAFKERHADQTFTVHRLLSLRWLKHDWIRFVYPWRINANAARIIDEVKPDVVHIQSHFIAGRGASNQAMKRGIRIVATNHFMPENMIEFTGLPRFIWPLSVRIAWNDAARILGRAAEVTSPTRRAADYLEQQTGLRGVHAVSCGIRAADYTPSFEPRRQNRIAFHGRVAPEKQLDKLLEAVALLPEDLDVHLDIVGDGDQRKNLENPAGKLGIRDRVEFHGRVTDQRLRRVLTEATVFAMPSIAELQSIATMEAMASGLPVVAADAMALPHLVHDGENGYLFTPGDVDGLAERLTTVLTASAEDRGRMQRASLRMVEAHDMTRTLDTFEALYRGEPIPA